MTAATILQIPTSLVVCIAVYLAGMWITVLYIGMSGFPDDNSCIVVSGLLWPLFLLLLAVVNLGDWMDMADQGYRGVWAQAIVRCIGRALHHASLPFRPYTLGREIAGWYGAWRRRRRSRKAGEGSAE